MASLPYMQLYVADYLADTFHLTTEEHGAYFLMLMNYWQTAKPLKSERIASLVRMDKERFAEIEPTLKEFFEIDENGDWYHKRIQADLKGALDKSAKATESAKKRWAKKALNNEPKKDGNANASPNAKQTECSKSRVEESKEEQTKSIVKKEFSFSLTKQYLLSNTSKEYQSKLKDYISNSGKAMTYEEFYEKCEMKPYKYKNFQMAYSSWNKGESKAQKELSKSFQSFKQQDAQKTEDALDAFLQARDEGFDLRNVNSEATQEVHGFNVIEDKNIPTNEIHIIDEDGVVQDVEVIEA